MIAIDTSALIAIITRESDADMLIELLRQADCILIGAPTELEARIVLYRRIGPYAVEAIIRTITELGIERVDFTAAHVTAATEAFARYGKGRHPAALDYGDCMAYAIAKVAGCPLLYKGEDFARTDIRSAL